MPTEVLSALGGLGLFLLGMRIMTEGLKSLAGDRLHRWLGRVTRTPLSGAATGALTTAVIQSSSATTVTAVGFVGAGLLTYEQSLGVIFGANIGTTITGWIVAVFGFKVKLGNLSLLLVFLGALLLLVGKGAWRNTGRALCGFALLFLGLDFLKDGMTGSASAISLDQFSSTSIWDRLVLLGVGLVLTVLTQSSSATVATTLAALSSGILDLPQALAVVIGADVGTTATAWLATLGSPTASRRTGLSHVVYNLLTGLFAFLILPLYYAIIQRVIPDVTGSNAALATVAFHSTFNTLGVILILPFTNSFATLMRRLVPDREDSLGSALEPRLAETPVAALATLRAVTFEISQRTIVCLKEVLTPDPERVEAEQLDSLANAISDCRDFIGTLSSASDHQEIRTHVPALLHVYDHVERLLDRLQDHARIDHLREVPGLAPETEIVRASLHQLLAWISDSTEESPRELLNEIAARLESDRDQVRHQFITAAAEGLRDPSDLDRDLDAHRWLRRCIWHLARICEHLTECNSDAR